MTELSFREHAWLWFFELAMMSNFGAALTLRVRLYLFYLQCNFSFNFQRIERIPQLKETAFGEPEICTAANRYRRFP